MLSLSASAVLLSLSTLLSVLLLVVLVVALLPGLGVTLPRTYCVLYRLAS